MTHAVATRFDVIDENGEVVASGLTGGDPITLATGDYRVVSPAGEIAVTIISDEVTAVGFFED